MAASPTSRSLDYARRQGWHVAVVEKWNPHARIRQDAFGFADLLILDDDTGTLYVQATSGSNVSARLHKLEEMPQVEHALRSGNRVEVWGWRKVKRKLKSGALGAPTWQLRRVPLELQTQGLDK